MEQLVLGGVVAESGKQSLPRERRVFCNRNLRLDQIEVVGFDMDYTLAIYRQNEVDRLSIDVTVDKLVKQRGYPAALRDIEFAVDFPVRGLLVDRKLGNVLKMDRYKYVKKAYHGMKLLPRDERRRIYHTRRIRPASDRYYWVDTLYGLSEVAVFASAVEFFEEENQTVDFAKLFDDIRSCADLSHQDGTVLGPISTQLPKFIARDPELGQTLHKLRSSGKQLFLLTNSNSEYTKIMMSYLLDGALPEYPSWANYFDYIVTKAKKPAFFKGHAPFLEVLPNGKEVEVSRCKRHTIYCGGNIEGLEQSMDVSSDHVLYVGDHIYGDVLRAKKSSAWRTVMIVQDMEHEMIMRAKNQDKLKHHDHLEALRNAARDEIREHIGALKEIEAQLENSNDAALQADRQLHKRAVDRIKKRLRELDEEFDALEREIDAGFHPFWGSLFKAGQEISSFGDQVEQYACLYTSRVSNLGMYSPMHYFENPRHRMPHERV